MNPNPPKSPLDDQYWYEYSKNYVDGSIERLDNSINSITTFIAGVYTAYTAASILNAQFSSFKDIESGYQILYLIIIAIPYVILPITQWKGVSSSIPTYVKFIPDDVTSIYNAYIKTYNDRAARLTQLRKLSFVAISSTGIALTLAFVISKLPARQAPQAPKDPSISGKYIKTVIGKSIEYEVAVAGYIANNDNDQCRLTIVQYKEKSDTLLDESLLNTPSKEFQRAVRVDSTANSFTATLKWIDKKTKASYSIEQPITKPEGKRTESSKAVSQSATKSDK